MKNNECGVTLVVLVVSIIVLMILAVVGFRTIAESGILDKATEASSITLEESLYEKVKLIYSSCEIEYYEKSSKNSELDKDEYIHEKFIEKLAVEENFESIVFENNIVSFEYGGDEYKYSIGANVKLKGNVEVGDYINYPIEYSDVYDMEEYTSQNGWRVLDDGVMEGSSGSIKIISTGIPMKWKYNGEDADTEINNLLKNFKTTSFKTASSKKNYSGADFINNKYAIGVSSLNLKELNAAYNAITGSNRAEDDTTSIDNSVDLFYNSFPRAYYWVFTKKEDNIIYHVMEGEFDGYGKVRVGVRPVVELKSDLNGVKTADFWEIVN